MARPREFEEAIVLDAAMQCFWQRGYDATSVRDLIEATGITGASLYNAFGDKRAIYERALDRYVAASIADRIRRCETLPPREGIQSFFTEILERSLAVTDLRGCMLVNAAMEVAPRDVEFQRSIDGVLTQIELFFFQSVAAGQADGTIKCRMDAADLARHLLGVLLGIRVLCRVRPDRRTLEGMLAPALALLDGKS
jgi:TetR/AcrR family transcriptional regulator, transcriptional repressor for nem operon